MNDSHARLQRTLRATERGERLESLDELLIRQVLHQPPPKVTIHGTTTATGAPAQADHAASVDAVHGSDAYRVLVQLRRQRQKLRDAKVKPAIAKSPTKAKTSSPEKPPQPPIPVPNYVDKSVEDRQQQQRDEQAKAKEDRMKVAAYRQEMAAALAVTQRRHEAAQHDVVRASDEMTALLAASQSILSSSFLFERNLTEFCAERSLEVIQRVLQKFQHRFYALYYQRWVAVTQQLRREAQRRAAATIARVVRGHNARTLRRLLAHEAAKLHAQQRQVVALRVTYRQHQALKIQRVWRRFQWKQHEASRQRRTQAVRYLQRQWRDRKLRRNALLSALLNTRAIRAAIEIQRVARGLLTRKRLARRRREAQRQALAMDVLTRNTNRAAMIQWQLERHGAAFRIAHALYPVLVRQRFRKLAVQLKRQQAGRCISRQVVAWYRHRRRRSQQKTPPASAADRMLTLLQHEHMRVFNAAVVIQKTLRRWWYQQLYETQQRRRKKLARRQRIQQKQARIAAHKPDAGGRAAAVAALAKASAGLSDVMKHARNLKKKTDVTASGHAAAPVVDVPSSAATKIQRAYVRHRHKVRFRATQWRQRACDVEARVRRRRLAAILIQKHVRGHQARRVVRHMRARHLLQQHVVRWKWRRATRRSQATRRILRWLQHKRTQRLAKLWTLETQRRRESATRLQRWLRCRFFYRKRVALLLAQHRREDEARAFATQSLVVATQHLTDELIVHSSVATSFDESIKSYIKSRGLAPVPSLSKPPARVRFAMLPLVFLFVGGFKDPSKWGHATDVKELLLAKVERSKLNALFKAANKLAPSERHHGKKPKGESFSMTDVDLAMAKAAGAGKSALLFPEFVETLQHLADAKLAHVTLWCNKYDGHEARLLALLWQFVFRLPELMLLVEQLTTYVEHVVDANARVVQRLFLRKRNAARGLLIKLQQLQQRKIESQKRAIVKVQAAIRRVLARKLYRARLQAQYDKYIDPEWGFPYWLNPRSGYSTWQKPWVLGDTDVASETVPYPPSDKLLVVACQGESGCVRCSDWYCYKCDEFFCAACEPTYHKKKDGSDQLHEMEKLRKCGLCQFQVASRHCMGCANAVDQTKKKKLKLKNRKEKSKQPTTDDKLPSVDPVRSEGDKKEGEKDDIDGAEEEDAAVLFCDVCFAFAHRRGALQVHKSTPLVELCADCLDDDALLDADKAPVAPKPIARAVQWACVADDKRVCGCCAWTLHPVEACGKLTKIPLVTVRMKEHAERLQREQEARERADTELIKRRELEVKQIRAAKIIQRFWHNSAPLIRARRVARALRVERDTKWTQYKHDQKIQKTTKYQLQNALGLAPPLPSDSAAQRKLREMNAIQRRQMGIRARAFGLLLSEYMELGVPLPGIVRVAHGAKYLESSEDLRGWLRNRQTLRLKKLPTKEQRDRARRIKFRRPDPPLEDKAWLHELERWMRDPADSILVDVDAKQRITEHNVPLTTAFGVVTSDPKKKEEASPETGGEAEEYAMFLVEFSMDPKRIVWVSHSLAERFAVWRKQKLREYKERQRLQPDEPNDPHLKPGSTTVSVTAGIEETKAEDPSPEIGYSSDDPLNGAYTSTVFPNDNAAWTAYTDDGNGYGYDYSNYYTENAWSAASNAWTYDNYGSAGASSGPTASYDAYTNAPASYDAALPAVAPVSDVFATPLVDSANYFYAEDGNAAAWQAYYAAHPEMSGGYDYSTQSPQSLQSTDAYAYTGYEASSQDAWAADADASYSDPNAAYATASTTSTPSLYPWEEVFDPTTQQTYYYNRETQQTAWEYPS